jgi:hypothetical protein
MKRVSWTACALLLVSALALSEQPPKISAEGGTPDERGSVRVLYWDDQANAAAGQFAINYGRPVWKKDYEDSAKFDALTKGKIWRLGSNFWSELVTDLPIQVAGKSVRPGDYYLGLKRSTDGASWALAFIDPVKARNQHLDAFQISKATIAFEAPMTVDKAYGKTDKLTITLAYKESDPQNVTMKVAWGNLALSAPIKAALTK